METEQREKRLPVIIGHRGASADYPENTVSSFDASMVGGIGGIETDVQLSKEGVPVIFHDRNLKRIARMEERVSDLTLKELKAIDMGSWFDPSLSGERILTLDEFLDRYGNRGKWLCLELKARPGVDEGRFSLLVEKTLNAMKRKGVEEECSLLSFNRTVLERSFELAPEIPLVFNLDEKSVVEDPPSADESWIMGYGLFVHALQPGFVEKARKAGKRVFVFPCDNEEEVTAGLEKEVDGIISNRPLWVASFLGRD